MIRTDTLASWKAHNPVLAEGEMGYERDTHFVKYGDGKTRYIDLPYPPQTGTDQHITNINTGFGLIGGPISTVGDLAVDFSKVHDIDNKSVIKENALKNNSSIVAYPKINNNKLTIDLNSADTFIINIDQSISDIKFIGNFEARKAKSLKVIFNNFSNHYVIWPPNVYWPDYIPLPTPTPTPEPIKPGGPQSKYFFQNDSDQKSPQ